ncbi:MAG: UDP-N-acetylmuramate dehydrogenase [Candidatus Omnitrophica bacterium]|nr:UDP-N-acetylmuramate dehydrogenase [Candidatus Omnitrophota bacterium]
MLKINDHLEINTDVVRMEQYTTFQIGGPCQGICSCQNSEEILFALHYFHKNKLPFIVMGQGSNLLVSDQGLDCYVIRYFSEKPFILPINECELEVDCSTKLDDLAAYAAEHGLKGINYASGIPGTVGGAIVGNAGAYGQQIGDIVKSVLIYDTENTCAKTLTPEDLKFAYRESRLKHSSEVILSARLAFTHQHKSELLAERQTILNERKSKHPDWKTIPSAGSVFKNVAPTSDGGRRKSAGWFLDEAGAKHFAFNGAKVFPSHANIIIKDGPCSAQDVLNLIQKMQTAVKNQFGIELEPEVRMLGKF